MNLTPDLKTRSLLNALRLCSPDFCVYIPLLKKKVSSHRYISLKKMLHVFACPTIPKTLLLPCPTAQLEILCSYFIDFFSFSKHAMYFLLVRILLSPSNALIFNSFMIELKCSPPISCFI